MNLANLETSDGHQNELKKLKDVQFSGRFSEPNLPKKVFQVQNPMKLGQNRDNLKSDKLA